MMGDMMLSVGNMAQRMQIVESAEQKHLSRRLMSVVSICFFIHRSVF